MLGISGVQCFLRAELAFGYATVCPYLIQIIIFKISNGNKAVYERAKDGRGEERTISGQMVWRKSNYDTIAVFLFYRIVCM